MFEKHLLAQQNDVITPRFCFLDELFLFLWTELLFHRSCGIAAGGKGNSGSIQVICDYMQSKF